MQGLLAEGLGRGQGHPAAHQVSPSPAHPPPPQDGRRALAVQEVEGGILPKPLTHCVTWVASPASVSLP